MNKKNIMVEGNVKSNIINLTIPMIFGIIGLVIFNLVDTYFVAKLGTNQLAAITFTFPIVLIINSIALGLSVGASSCVARAIGQNNNHRVKRLATDSLTLSLLVVAFFVIIGIFTIEPLFKAMGADEEIMEYIKSYMYIWYPGVIFVIIPMVGNGCIRALGDTKTPGIIMMIAGLGNAIMDPIFIFGWGIIPAMGIRGAAIATVISRGITFVVSIYVLLIREKTISVKIVKFAEVIRSWKEILFIGIPNILTRIALPLASGIITRLIAGYGINVVAGYGIALKIEYFALIVVNAISTVMTPFSGQNYGSGQIERIKQALKFTIEVSFLWGGAIFILLNMYSMKIGLIFNQNQQVVNSASLYMKTVSIAYGFQGGVLICGAVLNGINKPIQSAFISIVQMFFIYIPMAFYASSKFGYRGIFIALVISYMITFVLGRLILKNILIEESDKLRKEEI